MYAEHQPLIERYAQRSPLCMARTLEFALATAHRYFATVPGVLATHTGYSRQQAAAVVVLYESKHSIFRTVLDRREDDLALLRYLITLPGLGLVKAGFAAQLIAGSIGCLDVWNARAHQLTRSLRNYNPRATVATLTKKLTTYIAACKAIGTPAFLWDTWCTAMAGRHTPGSTYYPWETPEAVSAFHVETCCR